FFIFFILSVFFFFFQAEDGIRDRNVTGVQTCALPIFINNITYQIDEAGDEVFFRLPIGIIVYNDAYKIEWFNPYVQTLFPEQSRSEERRVGKECRYKRCR